MESVFTGTLVDLKFKVAKEIFNENKGVTLLLLKKEKIVAVLPSNCIGFETESYYPVYYKEDGWVCQNYDSTGVGFTEEIIEELKDKDILRLKCVNSEGEVLEELSEVVFETGCLLNDSELESFILERDFEYIPLEDGELLLADGTIIEFDDAVAI